LPKCPGNSPGPGGSCIIAFDATIKEYLKQIDQTPLLTLGEEQILGRQIAENSDPWARERFVRSNLRLVVNIAKKYTGRGISLADLIEEGNLGLIKAVDYFDPQRGIRFSTYAAWWIKQSIKQSLLANVQPIHVPTYMVALINQWRHIAAELEAVLGRPPRVEEMAEAMELSKRKAGIIHEVVGILSCIRDSAGGDGSEETDGLDEKLRDKNAALPEDGITCNEEKARVLNLLEEIDARKAKIVRLHYGLDGHKPLGFKEIGKKLGLTPERIRQLQKEALTDLYEYINDE